MDNKNPVMNYHTFPEAEQALGFPILFPSEHRRYIQRISVIGGKVLEVLLTNNHVYRMAKGTEDISGVHQSYPDVTETTVGSYTVVEKGCYGKVFLITWTDGTFTFSFCAPYGISDLMVKEFIGSMAPVSAVAIPNPMVQYDYIFEAEYAVGFGICVPACIHDKAFQAVYVIDGKVVEIHYENGLTYRVAEGVADISGVYRIYDTQVAFRLDRFHVLAKGNKDLYYVTLWNDGKFSYSLYAPHGVHRAQIEEFINSLTLTN